MRYLFVLFLLCAMVFGCQNNNPALPSDDGDNKDQSSDTISGYQPEQPIDFPHAVHAGINGIDCKYCHSVKGSKTAGLPTVGVCMDCHKGGDKVELPESIGSKQSDSDNPIVWRKVDSLPESVYFNHKQGNNAKQFSKDCAECHY